MAETTKVKTTYSPRLKTLYNTKIRAQLKDELKLKNIHEVPKLEKIVINCGLGRAKDDKRLMEAATTTLKKITGQQPIQTTAKLSIASFKLREGNKIGIKVTLRGDQMYEFCDRFINLVLPRLRDFHGVSNKSFDRQGNFAIGLTDQSVFPELSFEETSLPHGLQVVFVINSLNSEQAKALLEAFGMPFEKEEVK
ncbi:MAG TPA: 50S ribosomal protein L5 [Candidatus Sulfotelmatobacter sp.]|nr:50S ribosomal protein L5 [Candidatus Sulfotelmatobacter sp.]